MISQLTVNGQPMSFDVEDRTFLVDALRDAGLRAANVGCDTTTCGACTVLLDGRPVKACTVLVAQADGAEIATAEGLAAADGRLAPLQESFRRWHALQCGFCTPGMLMAATSLLAEQPHATPEEIRAGIDGNLCRCTGYQNIVAAIVDAQGEPAERGGSAG
jgi:carbon-monoxide dehydrogenase small subunit